MVYFIFFVLGNAIGVYSIIIGIILILISLIAYKWKHKRAFGKAGIGFFAGGTIIFLISMATLKIAEKKAVDGVLNRPARDTIK